MRIRFRQWNKKLLSTCFVLLGLGALQPAELFAQARTIYGPPRRTVYGPPHHVRPVKPRPVKPPRTDSLMVDSLRNDSLRVDSTRAAMPSQQRLRRPEDSLRTNQETVDTLRRKK